MRKSLKLFLGKQTDAFILRRMGQIVAVDRKLTADFILYLAEIDRRKLWADAGFSALYKWLVKVHGFSISSALKRSQVARMVQKYPFLYRGLINGDYSISVLSMLSKRVKGKNAHLLFTASKGQSVRDVEILLANKFPEDDVEDALLRAVRPLGRNRNKVQFMSDDEFLKELEVGKGLLSHRFPEGKIREVLLFALKYMNAGLKKAPRSKETKADPIPRGIQIEVPAVEISIPRGIESRSRYIPMVDRRFVEHRDNYQCQHLRPDGTICGETHFLELDHIVPFALGGSNHPSNLRLLCRAHNMLRAEKQFGRWRGSAVLFNDLAAHASPAKAAGEQGEGVG